MVGRQCPECNSTMEIEKDENYIYDPVLTVEEITYCCPYCGYEEKVEYLKQT